MLWRHILGYLPVNAVQGVVSIATIVLLTRLLDPDQYGRYALVLATTQLVQMACFTWLHAGMARFFEAAKRDGRLPQHFSTGYLACLVMAVLVGAGYTAVLLALDLSAPLRTALLFGLGMILGRGLLMMGLETHRAARHVATFGALETLHSLGGLALGIALIMATPLGEAGVFLGAAVASLVCLAIDLPRIAALAPRGRPDAAELRRFAAYGAPYSLMLASALVFGAADRFLIAYLLGEAEVGVYAAGYQVAARVMEVLFAWLGPAAVPLLIAAYEREGSAAAAALARRNAESMILITFPAAAGLALAAEPVAAVLLGEQYRATASWVIPWIALSALMFGFTSHYFHHAFVLARRIGVQAALVILPACVSVGLNFALIPRYGLPGAVASTIVSYALCLAVCAVVGVRYFPLPLPLGALGRGLLATAGMAVVVALVPTVPSAAGLSAKVIAGVLSYVPLALALDVGGSRNWARALVRRLSSRQSNA